MPQRYTAVRLYVEASLGLFFPTLIVWEGLVGEVALAVTSVDGRPPQSIVPATRALNSAEDVVNGFSMNSFTCGLFGPEYVGFGTSTAGCVAPKECSFQGPSTTDHSGLVA